MKKSKFFFLGLLSLGLVFTGCDDDDDDDNDTPGTCAAPTDLLVDDSEADAVTLSWTSTGSDWTIEYGETGFAQGSGTTVNATTNPFTVEGLMGDTEYDFYVRNNCAGSSSAYAGPLAGSTPNPIIGNWISAGTDVAPLLVSVFSTDSIEATFRSDQTFDVSQWTAGNETELSGTYTTSDDPLNGKYTIVLDQTSPSNVTSEGIFEVYTASPDSMYYEIVQTTPNIAATPPTPSEGFGSSNGGALGTINIQKYRRR